MNCYFHPSGPAVAQCVDCHKGLCRDCVSKYTLPICDACNMRRKRSEVVRYAKPLVICLVLYIIGYNIGILGPDRTLGAYLVISVYTGWKIINQFLPNIFIWFSFRAIFWYYLIRIVVSVFIGILVSPFYLGYCIVKLIMCFLSK